MSKLRYHKKRHNFVYLYGHESLSFHDNRDILLNTLSHCHGGVKKSTGVYPGKQNFHRGSPGGLAREIFIGLQPGQLELEIFIGV